MSMGTSLGSYYRGHSLVSMRDGQANASRYYHFDAQGTTQCLTNEAGAVTDRFAVQLTKWCPDNDDALSIPNDAACVSRDYHYRGTKRAPFLVSETDTECVFRTCMLDIPGLVSLRPNIPDADLPGGDCTLRDPAAVIDPLRFRNGNIRYDRRFQTYLGNSAGVAVQPNAVYWSHKYSVDLGARNEKHEPKDWTIGGVDLNG